jgi:hypothetical protein
MDERHLVSSFSSQTFLFQFLSCSSSFDVFWYLVEPSCPGLRDRSLHFNSNMHKYMFFRQDVVAFLISIKVYSN